MGVRPRCESLRIHGYDYAQPGAYFVTVCIQHRRCLLGEIADGMVQPNVAGLMVESWWGQLERKFPGILLDAFVVMPNHVHGIVMLGARVSVEPASPPTTGRHAGLPLQDDDVPVVGAVLRDRPSPAVAMLPSPAIGDVIQWFKTMTTNDYMRGVRDFGFPPFDGRLWQRNYYEHVIRGDGALDRIRNYIDGNPARWDQDDEHPDRIAAR